MLVAFCTDIVLHSNTAVSAEIIMSKSAVLEYACNVQTGIKVRSVPVATR